MINNVSINLKSDIVLSFKGDAENFCPPFYKCNSNGENPLGGSLNKHTSLLLRFKSANHVLSIYLLDLLKKDRVAQFRHNSVDLSHKEKSVVLHLAGYVFLHTFSYTDIL